MKTPEEQSREIFERTGEYIGLGTIAEIQRDAREGMVPVEDVTVSVMFCPSGYPHEYEVGFNACAKNVLFQLRAKHPNLFTK